ncbi:hypothetical protein KC909_01720 [Candidatus Dojkabacteria bacterium]|uniref:Uncharacterized protein n=1 Tax=Candidatus Dojkabacteria bacterium TaxID=2099670 RepID=A0A955L4U7_9BACT|nr:hypothetical protein [Candidatus Dojkabacteria bacterium]
MNILLIHSSDNKLEANKFRAENAHKHYIYSLSYIEEAEETASITSYIERQIQKAKSLYSIDQVHYL